MSEELKPEYKIFEDINLENNKIINVSEISSYDGNTGKYNSDVNNSGLYIHTPGNPTTISKPNNDKGLIVTTGHAQTHLDKVDNISNIINNTVKEHLNIKSNTKTDFVSPIIDIKSADSPSTEVLIRNVTSSDIAKDNGITITTDRTKLISKTSGNKTSRKNSNAVILDFSNEVSSHIDLHRADIYQANTQIFVAGTIYGYPDNNDDITDGGAKGNALYVDTKNVNIYVPTKIISNTDITGTLTQSGNVEINKDKYGESDPSTTIDGSSLNVNTKTVNIGNLKSDSVDVKTTNINIGTSKTNFDLESHRNILKIGSDYSDLTIKGRDFLIDSDTTKTENISVDDSVKNTSKSYLRSYYTNSNDSYIHDLLTIGPNKKSAKSDSHLQVSGYADITGNLDVDDSIDVMDTVWFHSDNTNTNDNEDGSKNTTSYIKSNNETIGEVYTQNSSLQINNDNEVIISNATDDSKKISIKPDEIHTKKNLNLDSNLFISGKLKFDSENSPYPSDVNLIEDLNDINTSSLKVSNKDGKNTVLTISTAKDANIDTSDYLSIDAKTISLTSINGDDSETIGTKNIGRFKQTGNTYVNTENTSINELIVKGSKTSIESANINIGSENSSGTQNINIGTGKSDNNIIIGKSDSNVILKGKDLELTSTAKSTNKEVSYLRVSDINTDTVKVNDSIIIGEKSDKDNSFKLYGNADISNNLDVHNTIYFHSNDAEDSSLKSYIQSNDADGELVINNDTLVTISNGSSDPNKISITSDEIDTSKKLDLNSSQEIYGTLTFDGPNSDKKILDLKTIETSSLSIETNGASTNDLNIKYDSSDKSITVNSSSLNIKSTSTINGDSTITGNITQTGDSTITGNVKINDIKNINTTDIDGNTVSINPVHTKIGIEDQSTSITVGNQSSDINISGVNRLEIKSKSSKTGSSETESKITVDKVSISNSTDNNKVNIYWDPVSSTLIFEKG